MSRPEASARFLQLATDPHAVLWTMSLAGEITDVSASIVDVRGITVAEAKAQAVDEIHPPESLRASLGYFEQFSRDLLAGRVPEAFDGQLEYFRKDGSTVLCDVVALPIVGDDGVVLELRGVSTPAMGAGEA